VGEVTPRANLGTTLCADANDLESRRQRHGEDGADTATPGLAATGRNRPAVGGIDVNDRFAPLGLPLTMVSLALAASAVALLY
jgi:hypothetical protein